MFKVYVICLWADGELVFCMCVSLWNSYRPTNLNTCWIFRWIDQVTFLLMRQHDTQLVLKRQSTIRVSLKIFNFSLIFFQFAVKSTLFPNFSLLSGIIIIVYHFFHLSTLHHSSSFALFKDCSIGKNPVIRYICNSLRGNPTLIFFSHARKKPQNHHRISFIILLLWRSFVSVQHIF